jgi:methionyl-tRNA synthetase
LKPILPGVSGRAAAFLAIDENAFTWAATEVSLPAGHKLLSYAHLLTRIDAKQIETMIEASKESLSQTPSPPNPPLEGEGSKGKLVTTTKVANNAAAATSQAATAATISIDDFAKLDLRIATVLQCEFVEGSDKLLRFELDAGELGKRQIFSGIRGAYQEPEKLVGRKVVFIANLAPRKMRFGVSEGMILSAGSGSDDLYLLDADQGAKPGMPVK